jgi:transcriptional regulator with XRE-family HTH domain
MRSPGKCACAPSDNHNCAMKTLAERLSEARADAGLSQGALAKQAGCGQSTIASIERGRNQGSTIRAFLRPPPSRRFFCALMSAFALDADKRKCDHSPIAATQVHPGSSGNTEGRYLRHALRRCLNNPANTTARGTAARVGGARVIETRGNPGTARPKPARADSIVSAPSESSGAQKGRSQSGKWMSMGWAICRAIGEQSLGRAERRCPTACCAP